MTQKAKKVFEKTIQLSPNPLGMQEEVANICLEYEDYNYAVKLLGLILEATPKRYDLMIKIGIANAAMGNHREALSYFIEAGKHDKKNIELKMDTAKSYLNIGQILRAEQFLKSVLKMVPDHNEAKELIKKTA
jgi:tetratricopeptide (TPR) repeat protein